MEEQALEIGTDAYVYAYPLVLMDATKKRMSIVTGINKFFHTRAPANAAGTTVVAPNNDTLYSSAWLDLLPGPVILQMPDAGDRYYMISVYDAWTNVIANPGTRTTGNGKHAFMIAGPDWRGDLPPGCDLIRSPTNMVWILARTYTDNTQGDLASAHAFQDKMSLRPLDGKSKTPSAGIATPEMRTPPVQQVAGMNAAAFFGRFSETLKPNPPLSGDGAMIGKLALIGIVPGRDFSFEELDPEARSGLARSVAAGQARIRAAKAGMKKVNGWTLSLNLGRYGTDYDFRAHVAGGGLGANLPEDAIYPTAAEDIEGKFLNSGHRYVLHFEKGRIPPSHPRGFWSVTMYNDQRFFAVNPLNRYAIHSADRLAYNIDGSLDIYMQEDPPSPGKQANWLAAPKGDFSVAIRIYWPEPPALDGTWTPPPIRRVQ